MPNKIRQKWRRPFKWPPSEWEFTAGTQIVADVVTAICFLFVIGTLLGALAVWPILLFRTLWAVSSGTGEDVRNVLLAVGALVGVPFLIWRTLIASKQTTINRESHYTALFTKAVEQLGAEKTVKRREFKPSFETDALTGRPVLKAGKKVPLLSESGEPVGEYQSYEITVTNYEVRLGAIYALERIAQDSARDSQPIFLTLCAYLQNNSPRALTTFQDRDTNANNSDVLEALNVVARFSHRHKGDIGYEFLSIHLPDVHLFDGSLQNIIFQNCSQENVKYSCDLVGVAYKECLIENFEIQETGASVVNLIGGSIHYIKVFASTIDRVNMLANAETLILHTVEAFNCSFDVPDQSVMKRSDFVECTFHGRGPKLFKRFSPSLEDSKFVRCKFTKCDFSFMTLTDVTFEDCVFEGCNCVRSSLSEANGNKFQNCLMDSDVGEEDVFHTNQRWAEYCYGVNGSLAGVTTTL